MTYLFSPSQPRHSPLWPHWTMHHSPKRPFHGRYPLLGAFSPQRSPWGATSAPSSLYSDHPPKTASLSLPLPAPFPAISIRIYHLLIQISNLYGWLIVCLISLDYQLYPGKDFSLVWISLLFAEYLEWHLLPDRRSSVRKCWMNSCFFRRDSAPICKASEPQTGCFQVLFRVPVLLQSCPTFCNTMDYSPARLLCPWGSPGKNIGVWVAMPSLRASSWPRDWTCVSHVSCTGRRVLSR